MKLTGILKKQVEKADNKTEKRQLIEKAGMKLTDEELEMVSGGAKGETGIIEAHTIGVIEVFPDFPKSKDQLLKNTGSVNGRIYISGNNKNIEWEGIKLSMTEIIDPMRGWVYSDKIRILF